MSRLVVDERSGDSGRCITDSPISLPCISHRIGGALTEREDLRTKDLSVLHDFLDTRE